MYILNDMMNAYTGLVKIGKKEVKLNRKNKSNNS